MDQRAEVLVRQLDPELPLPTYAHPGDAGADLRSRESLVLQPGERRLVPTGIAIAVPDGYAAFVHPRSGLAARHGISIDKLITEARDAPMMGGRLFEAHLTAGVPQGQDLAALQRDLERLATEILVDISLAAG